jgi:hypothetical protein
LRHESLRAIEDEPRLGSPQTVAEEFSPEVLTSGGDGQTDTTVATAALANALVWMKPILGPPSGFNLARRRMCELPSSVVKVGIECRLARPTLDSESHRVVRRPHSVEFTSVFGDDKFDPRRARRWGALHPALIEILMLL